MTRIIAIAALALLPLASPAQDGDPEDIDRGIEQLSEGARTLLRGLMGEVEPRMQDLADALREWDFQGLGIDDLGQYHPPEVLPNGDIIIRRKTPRDTPMDDEIEI